MNEKNAALIAFEGRAKKLNLPPRPMTLDEMNAAMKMQLMNYMGVGQLMSATRDFPVR